MKQYKLFWGDSHVNHHGRHINSDTLSATLAEARERLDFLPMAYYPQERFKLKGFNVEDYLPDEQIAKQWQTVCRFAADNDEPGKLVIFPGYEWQGDGSSGDHNVFFLEDDPPLIRCDTLVELYRQIAERGLRAYAIPHHTAYKVGVRAKDWSVHDEALSPFAEVYSHHGSSESDEQCPGLWRNRNMGPGTAGGTIEDGLNNGLKFGIIASNDCHGGVPGIWGWGLMACYAEQLTRQSLWEAFAARRVYGVTGDRIELGFTVDGAMMGSAIAKAGPVQIQTTVQGCDAIDRIELLRNNRVITTHCHQGTWDPPAGGEAIRCKLRIECGWGARTNDIPDFGPRDWQCSIDVGDGEIVSVEKCWRNAGQRLGPVEGGRCEFGFHTLQQTPDGEPNEEANIFEIHARPADTIRLDLDGKRVEMTLAEAMAGSRIVSWMDEAGKYVREQFGIDPESLPRNDRLYFTGHRAKIHRAIPEVGYTARLDFVDANPPSGTNFYRVRVSQRNGQMAWSSPVWVDS